MELEMEKLQYFIPEMEVVCFETEDVIMTSGPNVPDVDENTENL